MVYHFTDAHTLRSWDDAIAQNSPQITEVCSVVMIRNLVRSMRINLKECSGLYCKKWFWLIRRDIWRYISSAHGNGRKSAVGGRKTMNN
ncbi:MAG: hypothetical protein LHW59_01130 [Candidatus Cloacimonetes bacterium]|nr:hypothetical protein [Candidatus Cloacimonadota bacterium]